MPHRSRVAPLAALWLVAAPVLAQEGANPPPPPDAPGAPGSVPEREPSAIPGLEDADFRLKAPELLREGTFVQERRGTLVKLGDSAGASWAFVFLKDSEGRSERPMVMVPCQMLQRMQQMLADRPGEVVFSVSGHVYAYKGINYLEATSAPMVSTTPPPPKDGAPPVAGPQAPAAPAADPRVADLIKTLESQREGTRVLEPTRPLPASQAAGTVMPEGKTVIRRRGRMVRGGMGNWMFSMDSGTAGEGAVDRPLGLVPCMNLSRMEALAGRSGDAQTFEVSGRLLTYEGRNYLVPTLYQTYMPNDLEPRQ